MTLKIQVQCLGTTWQARMRLYRHRSKYSKWVEGNSKYELVGIHVLGALLYSTRSPMVEVEELPSLWKHSTLRSSEELNLAVREESADAVDDTDSTQTNT
jgi:hypothetical protein